MLNRRAFLGRTAAFALLAGCGGNSVRIEVFVLGGASQPRGLIRRIVYEALHKESAALAPIVAPLWLVKKSGYSVGAIDYEHDARRAVLKNRRIVIPRKALY